MTTSESKGRFFYKTNRFESIRITNRIESIRIANWKALLKTVVSRWTQGHNSGRAVIGECRPICRSFFNFLLSNEMIEKEEPISKLAYIANCNTLLHCYRIAIHETSLVLFDVFI